MKSEEVGGGGCKCAGSGSKEPRGSCGASRAWVKGFGRDCGAGEHSRAGEAGHREGSCSPWQLRVSVEPGEAAKMTEVSDLREQQDTDTAHRRRVGDREGWVRKGGEFEVLGLFMFS